MKRKNLLALFGAGLAVTLLLGGLWKTGYISFTRPVKSAAQIFKQCSPAVVQIQTEFSSGSGFIVDSSGLIVTNYHVIGSAQGQTRDIKVTLQNGEQYRPSSVMDHHPIKDICILKIAVKKKLPAIPMEDDASLEIGEKVFAIGNPLGYAFAISDGIVSRFQSQYYRKMIQFTCPVSPGSSGGPLLNGRGKAVGIVTEVAYPSDGTPVQNVNFALGINEVKALIKDPHELELSDFLDVTKNNAVFLQTVNAAYTSGGSEQSFAVFQDAYQKNCSDLNRRDCVFYYMEMIRVTADARNSQLGVISNAMNSSDVIPWATLTEDQQLQLRVAADGIAPLSQRIVNLVENAGGPARIGQSYRKFYAPSDEDFKLVLDGSICSGYSALAMSEQYREKALAYFEKFKNCNPDSPSRDAVYAEVRKKPLGQTATEGADIPPAPTPVKSPGGPGKKAPSVAKFFLYKDFESSLNHYSPTGFMGDFLDLKMNPNFIREGKNTCLRFDYSAQGKPQHTGWAGAYWQDPPNNWGDRKGGYDLRPFSRLRFLVRGEKGGESVTFVVGGIKAQSEPGDSGEASLGPLTLTTDWETRTIYLTGIDKDHIIGGFGFAATQADNPKGFTIYLDDIRYETSAATE